MVRDASIDVNTRCIRIHRYTPAEILLGYDPVHTRTRPAGLQAGEDWLAEGVTPGEVLGMDVEALERHIFPRDERPLLSMDRVAKSRTSQENVRKGSRGYRKPVVGDLILLRDIQKDKHHRKKLDPRWSTPRIVDRISTSGVSAWIRELLVYVSRGTKADFTPVNAVAYSRDALGSLNAIIPRQRAFDLSDIDGLMCY